ncbi:hypothetical protein [Enterococcus cecorum]
MSVSKYRKIPVEVRAVQYTPYTLSECVQFLEDNEIRYAVYCMGLDRKTELEIFTLEGKETVKMDDYIVCEVEGKCYICKPDIFEKTYEKV